MREKNSGYTKKFPSFRSYDPPSCGSLVKAVVMVLLLLSAVFPACGGSTGDTGEVLWFSDLHFNPFADPAVVTRLAENNATEWDAILSESPVHAVLPLYGKEANRALLEASLADMREHVPSPDFILFAGDFLAHKFDTVYLKLTGDASTEGLRKFVDKTLAYIVSRITLYYPETSIYFCLGNNDDYDGDYLLAPHGPFLENTSDFFADAFLKTACNRESFAATYPQGGHYQVFPAVGDGLRILSLNAVFLSRNAPDTDSDPGDAQLDWLEQSLSAAAEAGDKVWILLHIPPGVDEYATVRANEGKSDFRDIILHIKEKYSKRLTSIVSQYADTVTEVFAGHIHREAFRLIRSPEVTTGSGVPVLTTLSISPGFANNPGYISLTYQRGTFVIWDYETRCLDSDDGLWRTGHRFREAYGDSPLTGQSVWTLYSGLKHDADLQERYISAYDGFKRTHRQITPETFDYYLSAIPYLDAESYRRALESGSESQDRAAASGSAFSRDVPKAVLVQREPPPFSVGSEFPPAASSLQN